MELHWEPSGPPTDLEATLEAPCTCASPTNAIPTCGVPSNVKATFFLVAQYASWNCTCHLDDFYVRVDIETFKCLRIIDHISSNVELHPKMKPPLVTREFHGEVLTYYLCVPCGTLSLSPVRRDDMKFVPDFSWCDQ